MYMKVANFGGARSTLLQSFRFRTSRTPFISYLRSFLLQPTRIQTISCPVYSYPINSYWDHYYKRHRTTTGFTRSLLHVRPTHLPTYPLIDLSTHLPTYPPVQTHTGLPTYPNFNNLSKKLPVYPPTQTSTCLPKRLSVRLHFLI